MAKQLERKLFHNRKIGPFITPPFSNLSDRRWALFLNSTRCLQNGTAFTIYHGLQLTPSTMVFLKNCFLVPTTLSQHKLYEQGALMSKLDLSDAFQHILVCCEDWELLRSAWQIDVRELKQQTFAIHGGQPELKLHKSCALRMSHGRRGLSRRAPMNFSRPCRFATILILHGFLRRQR